MRQFPIFKTRQGIPILFWRPQLQLRTLPVESRWEVTRRHPSYFAYWKQADARGLFEDSYRPTRDQVATAQETINVSRIIALNAIGVVPAEAVDPATPFSQLGELNPAWESGAVHPTSMRGLASLLVTILPRETLAQLGRAFAEAGMEDEPSNEEGELRVPKKIRAQSMIAAMDEVGLDFLTPEPFISINPWASGRQVGREVSLLLNQWKEELDLSEIRERADKHRVYFDVWDRREGWIAGRYESGQGKRFAEIADDLNRPLTTIHSQYKKAFELITGHPYRFDSFLELFGLVRFSRLFSDGADAKYRRMNESIAHDVPESRLGISLDATSNDSAASASTVTYFPADFMADYKSLVDQGMTDEEAATELGVVDHDSYLRLIELYKMRQ